MIGEVSMFFLRHGWLIALAASGCAIGFTGWHGSVIGRWELGGWGRIAFMVMGIAITVFSVGALWMD